MKFRHLSRNFAIGALSASIFLTTAFATELKLASTPWPPFTGERGQPRMVIELVQEALRRAGVSSTVTIVDEGTLTPQLKEGTFEGSPAMWRDKDRESFLEYSAPLLENRLVLVGKKGSDVSAASLGALKGKRIGTVIGYSYGEEVTHAKNATFVPGPSHQANLEKLKKGELDYLLVEDLLIHHLLSHQGSETKAHLEIGANPLVKRSLHFALRKDTPNAAEIMRNFNAKLKTLLADGTYNRILELNWIQADVDGDGKLELIPRSNKVGKEAPLQNYSIFYSSDQTAPAPRIWVDGRSYSDWDHVPSQYKVDELARREQSKPLLNLKF